ncbi:unnamed protein product [Symbiodinium sp. CCMP2592]|nr:unnamed protein product [Symbiodinium sp. CCMP2592]
MVVGSWPLSSSWAWSWSAFPGLACRAFGRGVPSQASVGALQGIEHISHE